MLRKSAILSSLFVIIFSTLSGVSCLKGPAQEESKEQITLTMWGLFDSEEVFQPLIQEYTTDHKNIKINYVKKDYYEYEKKPARRLLPMKDLIFGQSEMIGCRDTIKKLFQCRMERFNKDILMI